MKKMLMVATVPSMIGQFNMNNIKILKELEYEVHIACDFTDRSVWNEERIIKFQNEIKNNDIRAFQIDFSRSATHLNKHICSYKQLLNLMKEENYSFVHCHTPIAGAIARLACKKTETMCIYTAHGFHFYKGAPLRNWLLYYPIERWLSRFTDILITINREDYYRAKKIFKSNSVLYVPGIGINVEKLSNIEIEKKHKRENLGLSLDDFVILSVGELNSNKNHKIVIKAISEMSKKNIKYIICGSGKLNNYLTNLINKLHLENQIFLLGYRDDVSELYAIADVFAFPSLREGLSVSLMEAMAAGLPCVVSKIRGNVDLIEHNKGGFLCCNNLYDWKNRLFTLYTNRKLMNEFSKFNKIKVKEFEEKKVENMYRSKIYMHISE